ncbi:MAG TPA: PQ-loop domain-containing transporter [Vicinamibacterales bacterium]|nr:PQ-loop domain-containing transporter [Vicinamibacterales bacterium]
MTFDLEWIGFMAAVLTTVAFVPQVFRTWQMGGRELSWSMLALFGTGVSLWFAYGVVRQSWPLMIGNGLTLIQVAAMAGIKLTAGRRQPQ